MSVSTPVKKWGGLSQHPPRRRPCSHQPCFIVTDLLTSFTGEKSKLLFGLKRAMLTMYLSDIGAHGHIDCGWFMNMWFARSWFGFTVKFHKSFHYWLYRELIWVEHSAVTVSKNFLMIVGWPFNIHKIAWNTFEFSLVKFHSVHHISLTTSQWKYEYLFR